MNYTEIYSEVVSEGFSHETALAVNIGLFINVSKQITTAHLKRPGLFWHELQEEMRKAFFLTDKFTPVVVDEAIAIVEAWHGFNNSKKFGKKKTIRECIEANIVE